jgi:hypothetical protein
VQPFTLLLLVRFTLQEPTLCGDRTRCNAVRVRVAQRLLVVRAVNRTWCGRRPRAGWAGVTGRSTVTLSTVADSPPASAGAGTVPQSAVTSPPRPLTAIRT